MSSRCSVVLLLFLCLSAVSIASVAGGGVVVSGDPTTTAKSSAGSGGGFMHYNDFKGAPYQVTYDKRSLRLNGEPGLFLSGSVHPPRSTTGMWDTVLSKAAADGLNMVEVYIFWNFHEPVEGQFIWSDRGNLTLFLDKAKQHNLFVNLRIGPYVCAEWTYGGIPVWLGQKEGVEFRTVNAVWQKHMQAWMQMVVDTVHDYFAPQGGPIIIAQVENELHAGTSPVIDWCGTMAASLGAGVPWIMCNGDSAPNTINTCNGQDCTSFISEHGQNGRILIDQPALWTENEGGFQVWGESPHNTTAYFWGRSAANIAYKIAQWFGRGGSHMNYYMWFGGNHYGRWAGASITTMYTSDVNLCPDMLRHEPKYTHLNTLHQFLAQYASDIIHSPAQLETPEHLLWYDNNTHSWQPGTQQLAFVYNASSTSGIAFVENQYEGYIQTQFRGRSYTLPGYSTSLVDLATGKVLFNTGVVAPATTKRALSVVAGAEFTWRSWREPLSPSDTASFPSKEADSPMEQSLVTGGLTQYLFYSRNVTSATATTSSKLSIQGRNANAYMVFVNGVLQTSGNQHGHSSGDHTFGLTLSLESGPNELLILSESFGFGNGMASGSTAKTKGIVGSVQLDHKDITSGTWRMRGGLAGEVLQVYSAAGASKVQWQGHSGKSVEPLTWLQTTFDTPAGLGSNKQLLLMPSGLNRGRMYVNGHELGRYWLIHGGLGHPTQGVYHIPADWLAAEGGSNMLTLVEVLGGSDVSSVRLVTSSMAAATAHGDDGGIETCLMW